MLYKILFESISDIALDKDNVYLYGSELEKVPFGILISEYDNLKIFQTISGLLMQNG